MSRHRRDNMEIKPQHIGVPEEGHAGVILRIVGASLAAIGGGLGLAMLYLWAFLGVKP